MSAVGLVGPGDIGSSLLPNSTATWLIDADSGEMIPHFVEVKANNCCDQPFWDLKREKMSNVYGVDHTKRPVLLG